MPALNDFVVLSQEEARALRRSIVQPDGVITFDQASVLHDALLKIGVNRRIRVYGEKKDGEPDNFDIAVAAARAKCRCACKGDCHV